MIRWFLTVFLGGSDGIHYLRPVKRTLEILNCATPDKLEMKYKINRKGCVRSTMARRNVGFSSTIRKPFQPPATISIILEFSGSELEFLPHFERAVKSYRSGKDRKMEVIPLYLTSNALLNLDT